MQYRDLKNKAKKLGLRVTKTVNGKRVKLSAKELRSKITMNFENSVKNAQRVIKICKTVVLPTPTPVAPTPVVRSRCGAPPPPPPPPPPVRPATTNARAKLLAELKTVMARKGLRNKM
jgi:hypothetical protein